MNQRRIFLKILLFTSIILLIFIVRFAHFPQIFGFDYDQEVNAFLAKSVVIDLKPTLIGPETSTGGMYVGPYFNYILSLFFLLSKMDPAGTAVVNIIIVFLTSILVFFSAKKMFSQKAGYIALLIYGFSYIFAMYDWVLWNPTPIPLVSLGIFFSLWKFFQTEKSIFLLSATALVAFMIHLHFTAFFLVGFYIVSLMLFKRNFFLKNMNLLLAIGVIFIIFLAPLIIFDLRHEFINSKHLLAFLLGSKSPSHPQEATSTLQSLSAPIEYLRALIFPLESKLLDLVVLLGLLSLGTYALIKRRVRGSFAFILFFVLFAIPLLFLPFYHGSILPYYLFPVFTPAIVVLAGASSRIMKFQPWTKIFFFFLILFFLGQNVNLIWNFRPVINLNHKKEAIDYIISDAEGDTFNVEFVTDLGMNTGFKYLFWLRKHPLKNQKTQSAQSYKILIPYNNYEHSAEIKKFGAIGVEKKYE